MRRHFTWTGLAVTALLAACLGMPAGNAADACTTGMVPARVTPNTVATANALDNRPWAVGEDWHMPTPNEWLTYCSASATDKPLLGKMTLQPRLQWFGVWRPTSSIRSEVREYIDRAQHGNTNTIVGMAFMRVWGPHGEGDKKIAMTLAQQADYKKWYDQVALGIGSTHMMVVLEPDLGVAVEQTPDPGVRKALTRYAAQKLGALPNTEVYIDGTASDWMTPLESANMLKAAGVQYVRGFALGATHYATLGRDLVYAQKVSDQLAALGLPGKKGLLDTADNGKGFTYQQYYTEHPRSSGGWFDNAQTCTSLSDTTCVTLGIPPTWRVTDRIGDTMKPVAAKYVDAYAWFGRPWLYAQSSPYKKDRALQVARTTPFQ